MTRRRFVCCCALIAGVALVHVASAPAGGSNIGVYPMFGYRGFYSNGFSKYGPPVPTYAPVPGMFGGSDQHSYAGPAWYIPRRPATPPGPDGPVLVPIRRTDQPRPGDRPAPPPLPPADREDAAPLPPPRKLQLEEPAVIEVRLPDTTGEVAINGRPTRQAGATRIFESPPLAAGQVFLYDVKARWLSNGQPVEDARTLAVEAGKRFVVDFTEPLPPRQARRP